MRTPHARVLVAAFAATAACAYGQVAEGKYLHTPPDPAMPGGIAGRVALQGQPLVAALAIPADDPLKVYRATLAGPAGTAFAFRGLPPARYDLLLVFSNAFYEGLTLSPEPDTLTESDRESIRGILLRSEPFYNEKSIHRLQGATGRMEGKARCICTFLRTRGSVGYFDGKLYSDHRRSLKLAMLEDVGPGWQVARTRELFTVMVRPGTGETQAHYRGELGRIRVTDTVRDLGQLTL